jgi:hypothetical protein
VIVATGEFAGLRTDQRLEPGPWVPTRQHLPRAGTLATASLSDLQQTREQDISRNWTTNYQKLCLGEPNRTAVELRVLRAQPTR